MKEYKDKKSESDKEPNILPATEVKKNPNPRANENIPDKEKATDQKDESGTEITDGEDG